MLIKKSVLALLICFSVLWNGILKFQSLVMHINSRVIALESWNSKNSICMYHAAQLGAYAHSTWKSPLKNPGYIMIATQLL